MSLIGWYRRKKATLALIAAGTAIAATVAHLSVQLHETHDSIQERKTAPVITRPRTTALLSAPLMESLEAQQERLRLLEPRIQSLQEAIDNNNRSLWDNQYEEYQQHYPLLLHQCEEILAELCSIHRAMKRIFQRSQNPYRAEFFDITYSIERLMNQLDIRLNPKSAFYCHEVGGAILPETLSLEITQRYQEKHANWQNRFFYFD